MSMLCFNFSLDPFLQVKIKMRSLENDNWWMFSRNQFLDRKYKMQELYQNHMEGDDVTSVGQVSCMWSSCPSQKGSII